MGNIKILASLPSFVDIICLLFDNIVRRSGISTSPQGVVTAIYDVSYLCIRVENKIDPAAATYEKISQVELLKTAIRSQPFSQSVSKEGGTGFIKIQKILNHDFRPPTGELIPTLDFGFVGGGNAFYVDIKMPVHSIKTEEPEE